MRKRFTTPVVLLLLSLTMMLLTACESDNPSLEKPETYNLEDYYHLGETGTWIHAHYENDELTHFNRYQMSGRESIGGHEVFSYNWARLNPDNSLDFEYIMYSAINEDSLINVYELDCDQVEWRLNREVSLWADKEIGDTIQYKIQEQGYMSPDYTCRLVETDASITVNGVLYTNCRVYECTGTSEYTRNYCEIVSYYAKDVGMVYKRCDSYYYVQDERRLRKMETKIVEQSN